MKRANIQCFDNNYTGYILIEDEDDMVEYDQTLMKENVFTTVDDLVESSTRGFMGHCNTRLGNVVHTIAGIKGQGELRVLNSLVESVVVKRYEYLSKGIKLAISNNGGYFPIPKDAIIEKLSEYVYTEKDINIRQFEGGRHWYASVGGIDVIDDFFGRQFNTYDYAHQTAIKFMKQLNEQKP